MKKKYQDEYKQITIKYNELKQKYEKNYIKWDYNDIIHWIISIDDKFKKYLNKLKIQMKQENITGKELCYVNKNDLQRFGITQFSDKVKIMQHIQQLVTKNCEGTTDTAFI